MSTSVAERVRKKIEGGGNRLWRIDDFHPLPARAVARELSRLEKSGKIFRIRKGVYRKKRGEITTKETLNRFPFPIHPARKSAAYTLGLARKPKRAAWATTARIKPDLPGAVLLGRNRMRGKLSPEEGALLEFLRDRGNYADSPAGESIRRCRRLLAESWDNLLPAILHEPPRVRAIAGALGQAEGKPEKDLWRLRRTLNPLSFYRGGIFTQLPEAELWQIR